MNEIENICSNTINSTSKNTQTSKNTANIVIKNSKVSDVKITQNSI